MHFASKSRSKKDKCFERIVPLIESELTERPWMSSMLDNAPLHTATKTKKRLSEKIIVRISWPAFSPDLNLIDAMWNFMKDFIQYKYPGLGRGKM